ncbi:hypothetical protein B0A52_05647 [Exophiala mesophila]|uniref:mRNA stability protein n=1 Tax=Exophiala mesophila TaxID=212818 RepID=A0A438N3P9_EXOME|nr:hypothetical protein B0A52_05647 [Exophiala mesophila]
MSQLNLKEPSNTHALARYGSLPIKDNLLRVKERKFFDSGDFAVSKATDDSFTGHQKTGKEHPKAENIAHLSSPVSSDSNLKSDADAPRKLVALDLTKSSSLRPLADH